MIKALARRGVNESDEKKGWTPVENMCQCVQCVLAQQQTRYYLSQENKNGQACPQSSSVCVPAAAATQFGSWTQHNMIF